MPVLASCPAAGRRRREGGPASKKWVPARKGVNP